MGTPYKGIRKLRIYKDRFGIEVRVHTRPFCTAVHPQEVTLSNPKEHCERRKEGEVRERDRDRAGAVEREPQIQENTKLMEYMQYIRDLVLMKRRCNISNSLATY